MKIMPIFGTRPEGIKMAPLVKLLKQDKEIECVFVNTAQHREMLDQVLELFNIKSDYDLNIMVALKEKGMEQNPMTVTSEILLRIDEILEKENPDLVLVHGDTTTTFAGAYAAFLRKIPVGHVEAGLRTGNMYSPFPEEMNRSLVGRIASLNFAATKKNEENLLKENVNSETIAIVGNSVIDALLDVTARDYEFKGELKPVVENGKRIVLMTTHRRENLDQLKGIYEAVNRLLEENDDIQIVFPVHKNPKVREQVSAGLKNDERVHLVEPLDYETFAHLMKRATLIITDSGGIQEEAPALGIPVLVARDTTERPEGIAAGTLKLVGTDSKTIYEEAHRLLNVEEAYKKMSGAKNPYGDGTTSQQIVEFIKNKMKK